MNLRLKLALPKPCFGAQIGYWSCLHTVGKYRTMRILFDIVCMLRNSLYIQT